MGELSRRLRGALQGLSLLAIVFVAYAGAVDAAFVYDDPLTVLHLEGGSRAAFRDLLLERKDAPTAGRPVTAASWVVNLALAPRDPRTRVPEPRSFHAVNVGLHLLAVLALWGLLRRVFGVVAELRARAAGLAFGAAALWGVHPLTTAAVTYVSQRAEVLMGLFFLLALYAALRVATGGSGRRWGGLATLCAWLSVGSKEIGVLVPVAALLVDRALVAGSFRAALRERRGLYLSLASSLLPFAALLATLPRAATVSWVSEGLHPLSYLLSQGGAVLEYLRLALWPEPLLLDHGWPLVPITAAGDLLAGLGEYGPPLVAVGGLLAATLWGMRSHPRASLAPALFFLLLAPTSSVLPILTEIMAEHRMYLPLAALLAGAVGATGWLLTRQPLGARPGVRAIGVAVGAAAVLALGATTVERNRLFHDPAKLWAHEVQVNPLNPRALGQLAVAEAQGGKLDEARQTLERALAVAREAVGPARTTLPALLQQLGRLEAARGDWQRALALYSEAVEAAPDDLWPRYYQMQALLALGKLEEAGEAALDALARHPQVMILQDAGAQIFLRQGRYDDARAALTADGLLDPSDPSVTQRLIALARNSGLASVALELMREARQAPR